jgi:DNA anti-recombination protein RmuC
MKTSRKERTKHMIKKEEFIKNLQHIRMEARDLYIELLKTEDDFDAADSVLDDIDGSIDEMIDDVNNLFDSRIEI